MSEGSGSNAKRVKAIFHKHATETTREEEIMIYASGDKITVGQVDTLTFNRLDLLDAIGLTEADLKNLKAPSSSG